MVGWELKIISVSCIKKASFYRKVPAESKYNAQLTGTTKYTFSQERQLADLKLIKTERLNTHTHTYTINLPHLGEREFTRRKLF